MGEVGLGRYWPAEEDLIFTVYLLYILNNIHILCIQNMNKNFKIPATYILFIKELFWLLGIIIVNLPYTSRLLTLRLLETVLSIIFKYVLPANVLIGMW